MTHAIVIHETGGPAALRYEEIRTPVPGPGQLLVEVEVAGVNFIDVYLRTGLYPTPLPSRPGKEGAGRVVSVGDGVTDWAPGDRVAWPAGEGAYATHALVETASAVRVPESMDTREACALMLQGLTAHYLAHSIVDLKPGDTVLVHAGAGGVGLLLTQLLTHAGMLVVTTAGTAEKRDLSTAAGATASVPYDDVAGTVHDLTAGTGLAAVFDGVGASVYDDSLPLLRVRGTYVAFGNASGPITTVDPMRLKNGGSLYLTRPSLEHFIATPEELQGRADDLFAAVAEGWLSVRIGATYPLSEAGEAHRDLEARRTTGKVLLLP